MTGKRRRQPDVRSVADVPRKLAELRASPDETGAISRGPKSNRTVRPPRLGSRRSTADNDLAAQTLPAARTKPYYSDRNRVHFIAIQGNDVSAIGHRRP